MHGPLESIESYIFNAFNFRGRASRSEYWWATTIIFGVTIVALIVDLFTIFGAGSAGGSSLSSDGYYGSLPFDGLSLTSLFSPILWLATLVPNLSAMARRLHDSGKSSLLILTQFVPMIGSLILLVLLLLPGEDRDNAWGTPRTPSGKLPKTSKSGAEKGERVTGGAAQKAHKSSAMDGYAVLLRTDREPSPEEIAKRREEVHDYFMRNVSRRGQAAT